jgi:hypothetical protein
MRKVFAMLAAVMSNVRKLIGMHERRNFFRFLNATAGMMEATGIASFLSLGGRTALIRL